MIYINDYDASWPRQFEALKAVLLLALDGLNVMIEHVGSTAVPGLAAKPIIDLDIVVDTREGLDAVIRRLDSLGYSHQGDLGITGREAFARNGKDVPRGGDGRIWPEHHLYVCAQDSLELTRHLTFRDYLRAHPEAVASYAVLKRGLAQHFAHDRESYTNAKTKFVADILSRVL